MASTLSVPLMSVVDTSHYARGHGHSQSHQSHGNRRNPKRAPLPRIPSERLDPRSWNYDSDAEIEKPSGETHDTNETTWKHNGSASVDNFVFPQRSALAPANGELSIPKRVETAPLSDHDAHSHHSHSSHHSQSSHRSHLNSHSHKTDGPPASMEETRCAFLTSRGDPSNMHSFQKPAIAGALLILPFLVTSILLENRKGPSGSTFAQSLFLTLILSSCTLLFLGLYGLSKFPTSESEKSADVRLLRANIQKIIARIPAIALPYFTLLQLDSSTWSFMILTLVASGLVPGMQTRFDLHYLRGWKTLAQQECWALGAVALLFIGAAWSTSFSSAYLGLLSLGLAIFLSNPPYRIEADAGRRGSDPSLLATPEVMTVAMIDSPLGGVMTLGAGVLSLILAGIVYIFSAATLPGLVTIIGPALATVCSYAFTDTRLIKGSMISLGSGLATTVLGSLPGLSLQKIGFSLATALLVFVLVSVGKRASTAFLQPQFNTHSPPSTVTTFLLRHTENQALIHGILVNRKSRHIFYFLLLNFAFMGVQTTYGFLTGSLGLLGDSVHMFFDCVALMLGISAAVMSKWPPTIQFPYGYGKIDTLAGLGNGVLLVLISIELLYESAERLLKDHKIERENDLLSISILGLIVNVVGVIAFHSTDDHDHGHSHSHEEPAPDAPSAHTEKTPAAPISANMRGIYLHILADLVSSVSVILSTAMIKQTGWSGWDAIGSTIIAALITWSAIPLITHSGAKLLLALPSDVEYVMRDTLAGVSAVRGVAGYKAPKFWLDDSEKKAGCHHGHDHGDSHAHTSHHHDHAHHHHDHDHKHHAPPTKESTPPPPVHGSIHILATRDASLQDVQRRVLEHLAARNMLVTVHVEREGEMKCWCAAY